METAERCCIALNKSWKQHPTKQQLDSHLPPISQIIHSKANKTYWVLLENSTFSYGFLYIFNIFWQNTELYKYPPYSLNVAPYNVKFVFTKKSLLGLDSWRIRVALTN